MCTFYSRIYYRIIKIYIAFCLFFPMNIMCLKENISARVLGVQPRFSLGNQDKNTVTHLQTYNELSPRTKTVNDLSTYMI